ncbi:MULTISPECIES: biotin transporter BioY [unclassified Paenibacillus]|uniref:biotin transporter BioY n=1 Tax=unclassified Paenibacillus TaxID=185978 RepID=UPI0024066ABF|nr:MULTISPECIES: biotin transporter BioY [unclassified Paenibacillus]MDF9839984.1 biotin transport system substrate-specific component [Paenibacillus sp. PastF-2]MDF9846566.1 biotin transport system substrate-specific component [Paenibacillus sp. PastM-2]MDF9853086.1 biotin transport system substrate-specific component [Paenibacillus sp. PastF-1]MDH6478410.1 biotin transport system substrate-specific component [Paenibacillus sp. PastH-2]MDH6506092.1 biotin transport system substrate-specific c
MKKWTTRGLIFSALFAGVMIALSFLKIYLPISAVPITLQTLAVMLAGAVLGARYGTLAVLIVIGLCAAGFPVMGGSGGVAVLVGPTAGYIFSWPVAAFLIGLCSQRMRQDKYTFPKLAAANIVFGALLVYPGGVWWLAHSTGMDSLSKALTAGMWPFIPGDLVKAVLCAGVVTAVRQVYPIERILNSDNTGWAEGDHPTISS